MSNPKELLHGALLKGPLKTISAVGDQQFAGVTTIGSGTATVTVSTTVIKSDSIILCGVQALSNQASGSGIGAEVRTISDSTHFVLGNSDGSSQAFARNIHWMIVRV